jgi:hypothetical protein
MNTNLHILINFISIVLILTLITYVLKTNNNINISYEQILAVGLTAGLVYLIIVYLSKESFISMPLKYYDDTK